MKTIPLTQGQFALVDDADYKAVKEAGKVHKWYADKRDRRFYAARTIPGPNGKPKVQHLHKFLMPGVSRVDHIDGDGLNNQRHNLRPATNLQNAQGFQRKRIGATSKYRGVCWIKTIKKWRACIQANGKNHNLGYFTEETAAAHAYDSAAVFFYGEYASPNFPIGEIRIT